MSDEDKAVEASYREIVGSLMWVANQTRPNIANAIRAAARLLHDPGEVHVKAARKIIEYVSATAHLGLTFRKDSQLEDVQLEYDLETYVDATTPTRPTIGVRSLMWLSVAGVHLRRGFLGRRSASLYPLQRRST